MGVLVLDVVGDEVGVGDETVGDGVGTAAM